MTLGAWYFWWWRYCFGSSSVMQQRMRHFDATHSILPSRAGRVCPNTIHVVVHALIWVNWVMGCVVAMS